MRACSLVAMSLALLALTPDRAAARTRHYSPSVTREVARLRVEVAALRQITRDLANAPAWPNLAITMNTVAMLTPAEKPPDLPSAAPASQGTPVSALASLPFADSVLRGVTSERLPAPLRAALARIQGACDGFRVISACRPGARVRGSGRVSLHASCKAADFKVARYACAYGALKGFPGGVSTDPGRVAHIHISYAPHGREWGARFAHWQPHRTHTRYAHRHGRRYARV